MDLVDDTLADLARQLCLERPLVFLDLETTGTNPQEDQIVEFAALKLHPMGESTGFCTLVKPSIPVKPEARAKHGITDDMLATAPTFGTLAHKLAAAMTGVDFVAFNGRRFDVPLLEAEFERCHVQWSSDGAHVVDSYQLWQRKERRDLDAALDRFAGGKDQLPGHRATRDAAALVLVLGGQLVAWPDLPRTVKGLAEAGRDPNWVDPDGKIQWLNGLAVLAFGKFQGRPLTQVPRDYFQWMLGKDFGRALKAIVQDCLSGKHPTLTRD